MNKIYLAGCVFIHNNNILLIKRIKTGWYELPGGKIEKEETPEETAKREIKEELSANIELIGRVGSKDFTENGHSMSYVYKSCDRWTLEPQQTELKLKRLRSQSRHLDHFPRKDEYIQTCFSCARI